MAILPGPITFPAPPIALPDDLLRNKRHARHAPSCPATPQTCTPCSNETPQFLAPLSQPVNGNTKEKEAALKQDEENCQKCEPFWHFRMPNESLATGGDYLKLARKSNSSAETTAGTRSSLSTDYLHYYSAKTTP